VFEKKILETLIEGNGKAYVGTIRKNAATGSTLAGAVDLELKKIFKELSGN